MSNILNKKNKFCIFDTETESLNLVLSRPYELAYSIMENGEITESHQRFIWWDNLKMSADAARITRFNYDSYKEKAEDPYLVYEDFNKLLSDENIFFVSQNGLKFDTYMIKSWFEEIGKWNGYGSWVNRMVDINPIFKAYQKKVQFPDEELLLNQYAWANMHEKGLKSNLTFMCKSFNIEVDETKTHEGLYDIYLTGECLKQLIYHYNQ